MKRFLAMILVVFMLGTTLAGCSNKQPETNSEPSAQTENKSNMQESGDEEIYELVMEFITYGYDDPDLDLVMEAVNEITRQEIGAEIKLLTVPISEMATKLGLLVAGGEKIDLVCAGLLTTPSNLASEGLLLPLTDYIRESEILSQKAEGILEACMVSDEIYAYPAILYPGKGSSFFYDAELAREYGIDMPEKISSASDWESIFEQVKESGMTQYGISLGDGIGQEETWGNVFDTLGDASYCSYGVVLDLINGTEIVNWYETDEYMQQSKLHREWYEKGYALPDSSSNGYTTTDTMSHGSIFGFVASSGVSKSDAYYSSVTGKEIASIEVNEVTIKAADVVNFCWGIPATSERPEKVIEFLELVFSNTDLANLLNYGIEGVHYATQEDSMIITYPEGVDASNVGYGSFIGSFGDNLEIYQREPLTDEFLASIPLYGVKQAQKSKFLSYTFDPSNVSTAITAVTAVISQYGPSLSCGIVDPEVLVPELISALKEAGIDTVIEENQKQLDAWLAQ